MRRERSRKSEMGSGNGVRFFSAVLIILTLLAPTPRARAASDKLIGEPRTPTVVNVVIPSSGTVAAGAKSVEFIFSSDFSGTVLGVAYTGAQDFAQRFEAPPGDTLKAIAYTRAAGSIRIVVIK